MFSNAGSALDSIVTSVSVALTLPCVNVVKIGKREERSLARVDRCRAGRSDERERT